MSQEGPSAEALALIDQHIESIEQLEILLFLFEWEQGWTASDIFQRIQSSPASIELRLAQLESAGLIWRDAEHRYRFNRADEPKRRAVEQLADCYRTMRVRVIEAIYSRKSDAVQTFADAFKLKKKE